MKDRQDKNERTREYERFQARARQALFVLLAVVLLLGFTACGDSAPSEADAGGGADTEAQAAERENLTLQERQWVDQYYSLLTEQQ